MLASGFCFLLVDLLTQTGLKSTMSNISEEGPEEEITKAVFFFVIQTTSIIYFVF